MMANAKVRTGANLFKDFQVLMQVWNHPACLQLHWERKVSENTVLIVLEGRGCLSILRF